MYKILVCGDRNWADGERVENYINSLSKYTTIIHGACTGADQMAGEAAEKLGLQVQAFPADWSLGKKAGPLRNIRMLAEEPDLVVAFYEGIENSRGTKHMVRISLEAGRPVLLIGAARQEYLDPEYCEMRVAYHNTKLHRNCMLR